MVYFTLGWILESRRALLCCFLPAANGWTSDPELAKQAPGMLVEPMIRIRSCPGVRHKYIRSLYKAF